MKAKTRFFYLIVLVFFIQTVIVSVAAAATRIMPLGDSITFGNDSGIGNPDFVTSYRKALWEKLIAAGYDVDFVGSEEAGELIAPPFDNDNAGFPGIKDDDMVTLLNSGYNPHSGIQVTPNPYLEDYPADIILLHIGTAGLDDDFSGYVEDILDEIDTYETASGNEVWVILALIINRSCITDTPPCPLSATTTDLNDNVLFMARNRISAGDKIVIVDMENGAGMDYRLFGDGGDMNNDLHPYQAGLGYAKMADVWFSALEQILTDPDPDPSDNSSTSDSGCFIGTAAYGLHMEPHAKAPGGFRDYFLHNTFAGRTFVDLYHSIRHLRVISTTSL